MFLWATFKIHYDPAGRMQLFLVTFFGREKKNSFNLNLIYSIPACTKHCIKSAYTGEVVHTFLVDGRLRSLLCLPSLLLGLVTS